MSDKDWITDEDLPYEFHVAQLDAQRTGPRTCWSARSSTFERNFIIRALENIGWNVTATARALGIPLSTLKFKMERLEIQRAGAQDPRQRRPMQNAGATASQGKAETAP